MTTSGKDLPSTRLPKIGTDQLKQAEFGGWPDMVDHVAQAIVDAMPRGTPFPPISLSKRMARAAIEATRGWRPVETAPKIAPILIGRHLPGYGWTCGVGRWVGVADSFMASGVAPDGTGIRFGEPTHWMPLPSPPGEKEQPMKIVRTP